jgi:uncharacterized glyoxalase superfamily protein PhnB
MSTVKFQGITPYLHYEDAAAGLDWLARVFGFEEISRFADDTGRVRESEMHVGDQQIWLSGRDPGYWAEKGRGPEQLILIWVDDVDVQYERVKSAGIDVKPPEDKPYGVRMFNVTDPEGYDWGFMQPTGKGYEQSEGGLTEVPAES